MYSDIVVSGVHTNLDYPPAALGMCMAYAKQCFRDQKGIRISQRLIANEKDLSGLFEADADEGAVHVLLFSNYLWNTEANLNLSRIAKARDPRCITIHGGPNSPNYTDASREFLLREPHVDFIVAGEGEETLKELLEALALGTRPVSEVDGLRFLSSGKLVQTAPRMRAKVLDKFPSPYLTGFFDGMNASLWQAAIIETFRGCPYACTFCDWGSNTGSKVQTFDLERVIAEVEWVASRKIAVVWLADSNFGMMERDVEITRRICEIKKRTGFPKWMLLSFAKNVKSRLVEIVEMMIDAGLFAYGMISLQTSDEATLAAVRRSNIKTTEYEKLMAAFARKNLPLWVELMMALPGSTIESLKNDLAYHFDRPIDVYLYRTMMLVNSPMADPAYQREHRIQVDKNARVVSTATMSAAEIERAAVMCRVFQGVHRYGIFRYILRWLQWERGLKPLDVIHDLVCDEAAIESRPLLAALMRDAGFESASPHHLTDVFESFREQIRRDRSSRSLSAEFLSWTRQKYCIQWDDALESLCEIQSLLMPASGRIFPEKVRANHDIAQWYSDWLEGRGKPLGSYGPGLLLVEDPYAVCDRPYHLGLHGVPRDAWELKSALSEIRQMSQRNLQQSTEAIQGREQYRRARSENEVASAAVAP